MVLKLKTGYHAIRSALTMINGSIALPGFWRSFLLGFIGAVSFHPGQVFIDSSAQLLPYSLHSHSAVLGDIDNDGDLGLISVHTGEIKILKTTGDGHFEIWQENQDQVLDILDIMLIIDAILNP